MKGVYYELLKPNQTITLERYQQLIDLNLFEPSNNSSKKTQCDFVARQCSTTRCKSN